MAGSACEQEEVCEGQTEHDRLDGVCAARRLGTTQQCMGQDQLSCVVFFVATCVLNTVYVIHSIKRI